MANSKLKSKMSVRVGSPLWLSDRDMDDVHALLTDYRGTIDEIAFFTGFTHCPLSLSVIQEWADKFGALMPRFKALGVSVGINHLATLGHIDENADNFLPETLRRMTDIHGKTCGGCLCPTDSQVLEYISESYAILAKAKPDFIWLDDDIRLEGHTQVSFACFCDQCLNLISEETGKTWTRESLDAALNLGSALESVEARRQVLRHNRDTISNILRTVRRAVDSVNPEITLGFMTSDLFYSGLGFHEWAEALSGDNHAQVKWRPGGGFYFDKSPCDMITKAHSIGRQTANLPDVVTDIQSEIENFPYDRLKKSAHAMGCEVAAYIASGCNGAALNVLGAGAPPENRAYIQEAKKRCDFYDQIVAAFGTSKNEGLWASIHKDFQATLNAEGDWFDAPAWSPIEQIVELAEIGLPIAYRAEDANIALLSGDSVLACSRDELTRMLSKGVIMDGPALIRLNELGLAEYTGFEIVGTRNTDTMEVFTNDDFNGDFAGYIRDCRQSFLGWLRDAYLIGPLDHDCRVLSEAMDYGCKKHGALSGAFENSLGGRVVVYGYYAWTFIQFPAKASQIKVLCRWLSRESLPAYVSSLYHKAALWSRRDSNNNPAMLLINASLDMANGLELRVQNCGSHLNAIRMSGKVETLNPISQDGAYSVYELNELAPWDVVLLTM